MKVTALAIDGLTNLQIGRYETQMQTKEQFGQFAWELRNIKKDLEAFLEMSRDEKLNFAPTLVSRMHVASARLKLFRRTLG